MAFEVGQAAAIAAIDQTFTEVKLKRNDRVKTISSASNTITFRDQPV